MEPRAVDWEQGISEYEQGNHVMWVFETMDGAYLFKRQMAAAKARDAAAAKKAFIAFRKREGGREPTLAELEGVKSTWDGWGLEVIGLEVLLRRDADAQRPKMVVTRR